MKTETGPQMSFSFVDDKSQSQQLNLLILWDFFHKEGNWRGNKDASNLQTQQWKIYKTDFSKPLSLHCVPQGCWHLFRFLCSTYWTYWTYWTLNLVHSRVGFIPSKGMENRGSKHLLPPWHHPSTMSPDRTRIRGIRVPLPRFLVNFWFLQNSSSTLFKGFFSL